MELQKGLLFHGRYQLVAPLGAGASAQVWKARDTKANNLLVALKIFSENSGMDSYGIQNFEKEFTTVYNMRHSNLLPPTGYDICQGMPYLVMQYCENGSCNSMTGRAEEDDIIKFLHDVSAGLEYLHDHNIIHQDIKPDNILLNEACDFMVTDFGISVSTSGDLSDSAGMSGGTRAYMGPERFEGTTVPASDVWSLGATAVELLTGDPPYGDHGGLLQTQGETLPELPAKLQPEVRNIILSCLAQDPCQRIKPNEIRQKTELYWETGSWVKHSQRNTFAMVATAIVAALMCLGIYLWDHNRTKVYYYKDYVERWAVPEGVGRVWPWTSKHMTRLYRFEFQKGKVRRVSLVNSFDKIIDDGESERSERPIDQDIYYSSEGKVSRIKVRDRNGKVLYVKSFNENLTTMSFQYDDKHNTERAISSSSTGYSRHLEDVNENKGRITRWLIEYDTDGWAKTIRYASLDNSEACDDNKIYGRIMSYDEKGHITELRYIGRSGDPQPTKWGLGVKKFFYDSDDNWIRAEYYTVDNLPSYDDIDGLSIYEIEHDEYGNVVAAYHKDGDGQYMLLKKNGVAGVANELDEHGLIVKVTYLGIDKEPIFLPSSGYAGFTSKYDENGFMVEQEFFDPEGNVCETTLGNSKRTFVRDSRGNELEVWDYNMMGELCQNGDSNAGLIAQYDSLGNMVEAIFYDKDKKPTLNNEGAAGYRMKYDERNLLTEQLSLGMDLEPAFNNNHICIERYKYDKRGNLTQVAFYDKTGEQLVRNAENIAGYDIRYDDLGHELERSYFDEKNAPCEALGGFARRVYTYDDNGHLRSERYYNITNALTNVNGTAGTDYVCDERGNVIVERPVSTSGTLAAGKLEAHYKYDKYDNCTETSLFENGKPAVCGLGYHRASNVYNSRNLVTETAYYDTDGRPCVLKQKGYAKMTREYDKRGNCVKRCYFGVNGEAVVGDEGCSITTCEYDVFGNVTRECFFGTDGKPTDPKKMCPVAIAQYDKHNNIILIAAQDGNGKYIINPNTGWAIARMEYDNRSNKLSEAFFNEDDKPMNGSNGCHKTTYKYDLNGHVTEEAHYDVNGKPGLVNGVHKEEYTYDSSGNMTLYALYDANSKPTDCDAGFHRAVVTYDNGTPVARKFYTAAGALLATQAYNKAAGEWGSARATGGDAPYCVSDSTSVGSSDSGSSSASSSDWRAWVSQAGSECPQKISDGQYLQSVTMSGNSVTVTIKLTDVSKYDLDAESAKKIADDKVALKPPFRQILKLPSGVSLQIIFVDKANRTL